LAFKNAMRGNDPSLGRAMIYVRRLISRLSRLIKCETVEFRS